MSAAIRGRDSQRDAGLDVLEVVGDQQFAVHPPHVRLNAGEARARGRRRDRGTGGRV